MGARGGGGGRYNRQGLKSVQISKCNDAEMIWKDVGRARARTEMKQGRCGQCPGSTFPPRRTGTVTCYVELGEDKKSLIGGRGFFKGSDRGDGGWRRKNGRRNQSQRTVGSTHTHAFVHVPVARAEQC